MKKATPSSGERANPRGGFTAEGPALRKQDRAIERKGGVGGLRICRKAQLIG